MFKEEDLEAEAMLVQGKTFLIVTKIAQRCPNLIYCMRTSKLMKPQIFLIQKFLSEHFPK